MSLQFLQFKMPCSECVVQAICKDKHHKSTDLSRLTYLCLALPDWDPRKKIYVKGLSECWANFGYDIIRALNTAKLDNRRIERREATVKKTSTIPTQYIDFLIDVINTIQWLVNSTSWREGELYDFDTIEIENKIKNVAHWLRDGK